MKVIHIVISLPQVMKQINKRFGRAVVTYLNAGRRRKALRLNVPASVVPACALTQIMGKDRGFMVIFPQHADEPRVATTVFDQLVSSCAPCHLSIRIRSTRMHPHILFVTGNAADTIPHFRSRGDGGAGCWRW